MVMYICDGGLCVCMCVCVCGWVGGWGWGVRALPPISQRHFRKLNKMKVIHLKLGIQRRGLGVHRLNDAPKEKK